MPVRAAASGRCGSARNTLALMGTSRAVGSIGLLIDPLTNGAAVEVWD